MSLITKVLAVFLFLIGGCFPFVIRKKKIKYQRKGQLCSCTDYQTSRQESIDSIDSVSVVEPTTWHIPSKGRKRIRTISGASNFSGTSTMSTLSEKDRLWLQAFRFAGRWDSKDLQMDHFGEIKEVKLKTEIETEQCQWVFDESTVNSKRKKWTQSFFFNKIRSLLWFVVLSLGMNVVYSQLCVYVNV